MAVVRRAVDLMLFGRLTLLAGLVACVAGASYVVAEEMS